jgi:NADPH:quinone reductase
MAIQVAKSLGASVITTVSSGAKAALARKLGADEVIFYRLRKVAEAVREWTSGDGVDVVIDPVGGETLGDSVSSLKPRGVIVNIGLSGGRGGDNPASLPILPQRIAAAWFMDGQHGGTPLRT